MALTRTQFQTIQREYEEKQNRNHRILMEKKAVVYEKIPAYRQVEEEIGSLSVSYTRMLLDGDDSALEKVKTLIASCHERKQKILQQAGLPSDYLELTYDCPDCQDTGYIKGEKCHCFKQHEITLLYDQSNIREMIARENFDTLSYAYYEGEDLKRFENASAVCHRMVDNFSDHYENLFLYGTVGTGKSFLSGCIAKSLLDQGRSVIYFSANALFDQLARYSFDTKQKETLYNFYFDLYNCDLVIIDDLGTEVTNSFVNSQLFALLNERHLRQKATVISTNLSLEELGNRYSDRIFSRITSNYSLCKLTGPDIRMHRKRSANQR